VWDAVPTIAVRPRVEGKLMAVSIPYATVVSRAYHRPVAVKDRPLLYQIREKFERSTAHVGAFNFFSKWELVVFFHDLCKLASSFTADIEYHESFPNIHLKK